MFQTSSVTYFLLLDPEVAIGRDIVNISFCLFICGDSILELLSLIDLYDIFLALT